jgi:hypothetical protein
MAARALGTNARALDDRAAASQLLSELAFLLALGAARRAQEITRQATCYSFDLIGKPARDGELLRGQATGKDRGCARRSAVAPTRGIVC